MGKPFKRLHIAIWIILLSFTLVGGARKSQELVDATEPFIDLASSIGTSLGNAKNSYKADHPVVQTPKPETKPSTPPSSKPETPQVQEPIYADEEVDITITGEDILIGNKVCEDFLELTKRIDEPYYEKTSFYIVDNWAVYSIYTEIRTFLQEQNRFLGEKVSNE